MDATFTEFEPVSRDTDIEDGGCEAESTPVFRTTTSRGSRLNLLAQANGNALPNLKPSGR